MSARVSALVSTHMATFKKAWTRDNILIAQEGWQYALGPGAAELMGVATPETFANIFYVNDGVVEGWENAVHFEWLHNQILAKNHTAPDFLAEVMALHQETLEELDRGGHDWPALLSILKKGLAEFVILYYSAMNSETPEKARAIALKFREEDTFFDDMDQLLRAKLTQYKGSEMVILGVEASGPTLDPVLIQERMRHFIYIPGLASETITLKQFAETHPEYEFIFDEVDANLARAGLKGMVAFKGVAAGVVQIIKRKEDVAGFVEGNILLSPMTTPHYLPAMHKAAAFVTDEGGITCHAAIIARELKKPCLTGTKIATKIFKNGDRVVVDCDAGTIVLA